MFDSVHAVEKSRPRRGRVIEIGQRKFAQAEKPVRVPGPFHIQVVAEIEGHLDLRALQFVHDGAVVDALNGRERPVAVVKEPVALLAHLAHIHGAHAEHAAP